MSWIHEVKLYGAVALILLISIGCSSNITHRVAYPPSDELFVTMGDDPGSESEKDYVPKGTFIHVSTEAYIPLPILGLTTIGNANPQYVFETDVLPKVKEMGGDALTSARVTHIPPPHPLWRFFGVPLMFMSSSSTVVTGQVVMR